jgi:hypothetical protein
MSKSQHTPDIHYQCARCGHEQILYLTPVHKAAPETAAERDRLKAINAELVEALEWAIPYVARLRDIQKIRSTLTKAREGGK